MQASPYVGKPYRSPDEEDMDPSLRSALGAIKSDGRRGRIDGLDTAGQSDLTGPTDVVGPSDYGSKDALTGPTDYAKPRTQLTPENQRIADSAGDQAESVLSRGGGVLPEPGASTLTPSMQGVADRAGDRATSMLDRALPRNIVPGVTSGGGAARPVSAIVAQLRNAASDQERDALLNELERGAGDRR